MPKSRPPYPPDFRRQMPELVHSGRSPESLAEEYEPSSCAASWQLSTKARTLSNKPSPSIQNLVDPYTASFIDPAKLFRVLVGPDRLQWIAPTVAEVVLLEVVVSQA